MDGTMNYVCLLKDHSLTLKFDDSGYTRNRVLELYNGGSQSPKYFKEERCANLEQVSFVCSLLDKLDRSSFGNEIIMPVVRSRKSPAHYFDIGVELRRRFVEKLSAVLVEPKLAIYGQFSAINVDGNGQLEKDLGVHPFNLSNINFNPNSNKVNEFEGKKKMEELCRNSLRAAMRLEIKLKYSVVLKWNGIEAPSVPGHKVELQERLQTEKLFPECFIIAANNAEISCHRGILAAHSDVFHTMLSSSLTETQVQKIEIKDVSEQGVNAFVNYLNQDEINVNEIGEEVALELLQVSHRYHIPKLERIMLKMLEHKTGNWFSLGGAVAVFLFAEEIEEYKLLYNKMLDFLKRTLPLFRSTLAYQNLKEQNSKVAADLDILVAKLGAM